MKSCLIVSALFIGLLGVRSAAQDLPAKTAKDSESKIEQPADELKAKAVALVNLSLNDAAALKLPENRAGVFAAAADLLWQTDEKQARALFRRAAEEAQTFQNEDQEDDNETDLLYKFELRRGVFSLIARRDPDLAFTLMRGTRSPELAAVIDKSKTVASVSAALLNNPADWRSRVLLFQVSREIELASHLLTRAVVGNPAQAVKLLRAHKNATWDQYESQRTWSAVLPALDKLRRTDLDAASDLANEIIQELTSAQLITNQYVLTYLLLYLANDNHGKDETLKIKPELLAKLVTKVSAMYSQVPDYSVMYSDLTTILPTLERFLSADAMQKLRARREIWREQESPDVQFFAALENYRRADVSVDKILADAAKMPVKQRKLMYSEAVQKLSSAKDFAGARQLISEKIQSNERESYLTQVQRSELEESIESDKLENSGEILSQVKNKNVRLSLAVRAARAINQRKTKESRQTALKLLDDARRTVDATPETENETAALLQLIGGYAEIEPNTAVELLEPTIDNFNDLLRAGALVRKFVKNKNEFRGGEFVTASLDQESRSFFVGHTADLNKLARFDFARINNLVDKFSRPEIQIAARMLLAESILQPEAEFDDEFTITDSTGRQIGIGLP